MRGRGGLRRSLARRALRAPVRADPVAADAVRGAGSPDRADQVRLRRALPSLPTSGNRRRAGRALRPYRGRPLPDGDRPGRDAARFRDVQDHRSRSHGDAGRIDRHDPRHLGVGAALRLPRQILGLRDQGQRAAGDRRRRDGQALPEASPAGHDSGDEPRLRQHPPRRPAGLDVHLGQFRARRRSQGPLARSSRRAPEAGARPIPPSGRPGGRCSSPRPTPRRGNTCAARTTPSAGISNTSSGSRGMAVSSTCSRRIRTCRTTR